MTNNRGPDQRRSGADLSQTEPHEEFLELCALSISDCLTEGEQQRLQEHLAACRECREAMRQFDAVVVEAIPAIGPEQLVDDTQSDSSWSQEQAEAAFFRRLALEEESGTVRGGGNRDAVSDRFSGVLPFAGEATWRNVWTLYAAAILLMVTLGVCAFQVGVNRGIRVVRTASPSIGDTAITLEQRLAEVTNEYQNAHAESDRRGRAIADLRRDLRRRSDQVNDLKSAQDQLQSGLRGQQLDQQLLLQQKSRLTQELATVQSQVENLQAQLNLAEESASKNAALTAALEAQQNQLSLLLQDRDDTIAEQGELLAHDRDIRELMGARDLYIGEVYDVAQTGETKKPFGRVFYTKGKSLIFYAYDLDQQTEVRNAKTFQAWGQDGTDRQHAISLGIFYEDNTSKKRWVLRYADSKALEHLDAVFVTVEPPGGSPKPGSKRLLFAYLRITPNHP